MDAGTLFWIVLIGGGVLAMVFMHRGGHAHGGLGGGGSHGHGHGGTSSDEPRNEETKPLAKAGSQGHAHDPEATGGKHRGC